MDILADWEKIRIHFSKSFRRNLHVAIASVDAENNPTTTPVGSLFLNADQTGFYFEKFVTKLPVNATTNNKICVLGVNSNRWLWIRSLYEGRFRQYPALKLYGELGALKKASDAQIRALARRVRRTKDLKGHKYLWDDMIYVREVTFTKAEKINLGKMTRGL
ncbi:hypothetical protein ACFQ1M_10975 [Sungkyunkwania multivorans]|uniref:Pyridoxamine 5'-phosphate oxidase putative domain-containing protein n=1 Tax=Sungkyunkwania multivorans TaxID=1173618 RepID=A0ABW3D0R9_9FLAO